MSQSLHARPSQLLAVSHSAAAFYLDRAVAGVGRMIEAEIEAATRNAKNEQAAAMKAQMVMNKWLRAEGGARYRDPAVG